jgi:hypothetical protein
MADRYWVGGTGTWNITTTNWSASSGGASGASVPTVNDNVFFDNNSGGSGFIVTCDVRYNPSISSIVFNRTALPMRFVLTTTSGAFAKTLTIANNWVNNSGSLLTCDASNSSLDKNNRIVFYTSVAPTGPKRIKTGNIQMGFGFFMSAASGLSAIPTWTMEDNWIVVDPYSLQGVVTSIYVDRYSKLDIGSNSISSNTFTVEGILASSGGTLTVTGSSYVSYTGTVSLIGTGINALGQTTGSLNIIVDYAGGNTLTTACETITPGYNANWTFKTTGNALLYARSAPNVYTTPTVNNMTFASTYTGTVKTAANPYTNVTTGIYIYGNLNFGTSATYNVNQWAFRGGSGSVSNITTNGVNLNTASSANAIIVGAPGDLAVGPTVNITENNTRLGRITVNVGTFNTNNYDMTISSLYTISTEFKTINLGSSTITLNDSAALKMSISGYAGMNYGTSTLILSGSASAIYGSSTGNQIWNLVIAGAGPTTAGSYVRFYGITDIKNNLSSTITVPYTIYVDPYTVSTYLSVQNFNISGTAGNLVNINVFGGVGQGRINMWTQNPTTDYLSIANTRANSYDNAYNYYYAGYNSVNGGNNTNWVFTAPSTSSGILAFF